MIGQGLEKFRKRLGAERAKVLVDVSKSMATASFIGAGALLRSSFFSAMVLTVGGLMFLALVLSEPSWKGNDTWTIYFYYSSALP
jgi:hypothetical protein